MAGACLYIAERGLVGAATHVIRQPDDAMVAVIDGESAVRHPLTPEAAVLQRGRTTANQSVGIIGHIPGQDHLRKAAERALGRHYFVDSKFVCYPPEGAVVKGALEILADLIPFISGRHALVVERPVATNFSCDNSEHQPEPVSAAAPEAAAPEAAALPAPTNHDAAVERRKRDRAVAMAQTELGKLIRLLRDREKIKNSGLRAKLMKQTQAKIDAQREALKALQETAV